MKLYKGTNWKFFGCLFLVFGFIPLMLLIALFMGKWINKAQTEPNRDLETTIKITTLDYETNKWGTRYMLVNDLVSEKEITLAIGSDEEGFCIPHDELEIGDKVNIKGVAVDSAVYSTCYQKDIIRKIIQGDYYFEIVKN